MTHKIDTNRLDKSELSYELRIRGISLGTVESMRSSLSMAFRMEKSGNSFSFQLTLSLLMKMLLK